MQLNQGVKTTTALLFRNQAVTNTSARGKHLLLSALDWAPGFGFGRLASERAPSRGEG